MPPFPTEDTEALIKVDRAHKGLHLVNAQYRDELDAAVKAIDLKHSPFIYAAQSVLYEALRNASLNGFDTDELQQAMGCDHH